LPKQTTVSEFDSATADEVTSSADGADVDDPPEPVDGEPAGEGGRESTSVELVLTCPDTEPPATGWLEPHLRRILTRLSIARAELTLALVDDTRMAELHEQHCGQPGTTDVLTFDLRETASEPLTADIAIGRDVAARQAEPRGHDARSEALLYAVHAVLHLLGYDDHTPTDAAAMHTREDELLTAVGLAPVYASGARERTGPATA